LKNDRKKKGINSLSGSPVVGGTIIKKKEIRSFSQKNQESTCEEARTIPLKDFFKGN